MVKPDSSRLGEEVTDTASFIKSHYFSCKVLLAFSGGGQSSRVLLHLVGMCMSLKILIITEGSLLSSFVSYLLLFTLMVSYYVCTIRT